MGVHVRSPLRNPPRFAVFPSHIRAVDFGHVLVFIDYRTGRVRCLLPAAAALWQDAARTGRLDAMAPGLAVRLLTDGLLVPAPVSMPWTAPVTARSAPASWGGAEHPAGISRPPSVPRRSGIAAAAALTTVLAIKRAGPATSAMHRVTATLRAAASICRHAATTDQVNAAVLAVRHVGWYSPGRTACLEESAATVLLLASRRLAVTWCHGVAPDPVRLHAWVQTVDGIPVGEPRSTLACTPVLAIGGRHQRQP
ncbi:lasso peptide biosynthesis B2 protein [Streptomyces sp. SID4917]|nr:lasso peptide biosynthesis B2 protein [Streptomyces sp. SID4917]